MVRNRIKVFARIKREKLKHQPLHEIIPSGDCDVLHLYREHPGNLSRNGSSKFRFEKIFDANSDQNEVFQKIARPLIEGALDGYNGTIFAYGPTGSGKTYSLTGSSSKYANRGIIPRAIEHIFSLLSQNANNFAVSISYLEIYNEIAYDLLSTKQTPSTLEELPRVVFLEDARGEAHYKNLSVISVRDEQEAMQLLYLGDTKRTIAETPLNEYSSRSHCIFTLYLSMNPSGGKLTRSKLNLVDLAGSERLNKIALNGVTLNEAKYINLSLHYLEQVFIALSESKRAHVPFRNSVMTFMLRDSIAGNCLTAMLATLSITKNNYEEAVTTCKFAKRVGTISTEASINETFNTEDELKYLRSEVLELRKKVFEKETLEKTQLTKVDEENCKIVVKKYLSGSSELDLSDSRKIKIYLDLLKDEIKKAKEKRNSSKEEIEKYKEIVQQKDQEITILTNLLQNKNRCSPKRLPKATEEKSLITLKSSDREAFEDFISLPENQSKLNFFFGTLKEKLSSAKDISQDLATYQKEIINLRREIDDGAGDGCQQISFALKTKQNKYRETLLKMQNIKSEIEYLHEGLEAVKGKLICEFRKGFNERFGGARMFGRDAEDRCLEKKSREVLERNVGHESVFQDSFQAEFDKFCAKTSPRNCSSLKTLHRSNFNLELNAVPSRDFVEHSRSSFSLERNQGCSKFCETAQLPNYKPQDQQITFRETNYSPNYKPQEHLKQDCLLRPSSGDLLEEILPTNYLETTRFPNYRPQDQELAKLDQEYLSSSSKDLLNEIFPSNCRNSSTGIVQNHEGNNFGNCDRDNNFDINAELDLLFASSVGPRRSDVVRFVPAFKKPAEKSFVEPTLEKPQKLSNDFEEFMKNVPLTGEADIDDEIIKFYKMKFQS